MPRDSLTGLLLEYYRRHSGEVAFVQQHGYRRESWTYGRVLSAAMSFAGELDRRNIVRGDRIVLWAHDSAEWVAIFLGSMLRGVVLVPLDRISTPDFVARIARQTAAKLVVHSRELSLSNDIPSLSFDDLVHLPPHIVEPIALSRTDTLQIIFTSGATTEPKGVVTTHGNVLANLEPFEQEIAKYLRYERIFHPLRFLDLVPLSHVFGQFMSIFIPPLIGATVVFPPALNPGEILRAIKQERVSVLVAVPRMLESLQRALASSYPDLAERLDRAEGKHFTRRWWIFRDLHRRLGWKFWAIVSGGATLEPAQEAFWERLGFVLLQGYGLTESTSLISVNHPFQRGRGTIGKVLPGRDLKLTDTGEILVRGENIAAHYWQAGAHRPVADDEGWFHTGDLGELDSAGYLHFKGRQKNVIVTPEGMKVFPADLEAALRVQPEIKDAVVFGIDRQGNAEPFAVLLADDADRAAAAVSRANQQLAPYQRILHHAVWPEPDFPRTATNKPRLATLQAFAIQAQRGATPSLDRNTELAGLVRKISNRADGYDLSLSSLERVELICAIEERYQIDLNESAFAEARTMSDLEHLVAASTQPRASASKGLATPPETAHAPRAPYIYPRWPRKFPIPLIRTLVYHLITLPVTYLFGWPKISGRHWLRRLRGPALIVSNHITYVDQGFILAALPFRLRKLAIAMEGERLAAMRTPRASASLIEKLVLRLSYYLMTALFYVFPLPKLSGFRQSFAFTGELVDLGYSVLVFPEGRRTPDGALHPFASGIGLLAAGLQIPIIPMRIRGLWETKQSGWRVIAPWGAIRVHIGQVVSFAPGTPPEEIVAELELRMRSL